MTFLEITKAAIADSWHTPNDIIFIGSLVSGHSCTWNEFCDLADFDYDSVAIDLRIVFKDNTYLYRDAKPGSES